MVEYSIGTIYTTTRFMIEHQNMLHEYHSTKKKTFGEFASFEFVAKLHFDWLKYVGSILNFTNIWCTRNFVPQNVDVLFKGKWLEKLDDVANTVM